MTIRIDLARLDSKTSIGQMGCDSLAELKRLAARIDEAEKQYLCGLITIDEAIKAVNR